MKPLANVAGWITRREKWLIWPPKESLVVNIWLCPIAEIFCCLEKRWTPPNWRDNWRIFDHIWRLETHKTKSKWCSTHTTVFENYSKCRIWIFQFWHFPPIFVLLNLTCLVTLFDRKLQVFKNSPNWTIFGIFNQLLSTQNVNVARFARNVEWDFFCDFQTPWILWIFVHFVVRCVALQGVVIM